MEQTKGYLTVKGKIWGLNNKEPLDNGAVNFISFGLQTNKDNSLFIQVGEWKNTTLNIKIKGEGMEETLELNEQAAIDKIKELFKDGNSIFINTRSEVDTYRKNLKFLVNQMYLEKEPIDFDKEGFEETNELNQAVVIIEKPQDRKVKVGVTNFKGEMIELELQLNDNDVNDYFMENVKVGDLMKLSIKVNRKPNYVESEEETTKARKTLKGKTVGGGTKKRKIDGYTESLEVIDVDIEKVEKQKYDRTEIREALEKAESANVKKTNNTNSEDNKQTINEEELPY